jgi:hypothetical protein
MVEVIYLERPRDSYPAIDGWRPSSWVSLTNGNALKTQGPLDKKTENAYLYI